MRSSDDISRLLTIGEPTRDDHDPRAARLAALAKAMGAAPERDAPVREVMARLGDNWSALILKVLETGTYRHATLKRVVGALSAEGEISQRMLTLRLRALERDGFVTRDTLDTVPPRVEYRLTALGDGLVSAFGDLLGWIEIHSDRIEKARAAFNET
ncbi:helix-turn-helix transcriptional regulator [Thioclava sp. BHET1]|nr:helix-turn-helix transcriptional regulator [Thioclava sp. BHET1]